MLDETAEGNVFAALRMREADLEKHLNNGQTEKKDEAREKAREEARKRLEGSQEVRRRAQAARIRHRQGLPAGPGLNQLRGKPVLVKQDTNRAQGKKEGNAVGPARSAPQGRLHTGPFTAPSHPTP